MYSSASKVKNLIIGFLMGSNVHLSGQRNRDRPGRNRDKDRNAGAVDYVSLSDIDFGDMTDFFGDGRFGNYEDASLINAGKKTSILFIFDILKPKLTLTVNIRFSDNYSDTRI